MARRRTPAQTESAAATDAPGGSVDQPDPAAAAKAPARPRRAKQPARAPASPAQARRKAATSEPKAGAHQRRRKAPASPPPTEIIEDIPLIALPAPLPPDASAMRQRSLRARSAPAVRPATSQKIQCPLCDYALPATARFCRSCGTRQSAGETVARPDPTPPPSSTSSTQLAPIAPEPTRLSHPDKPAAGPSASGARVATESTACSTCSYRLPKLAKFCRACGAQQRHSAAAPALRPYDEGAARAISAFAASLEPAHSVTAPVPNEPSPALLSEGLAQPSSGEATIDRLPAQAAPPALIEAATDTPTIEQEGSNTTQLAHDALALDPDGGLRESVAAPVDVGITIDPPAESDSAAPLAKDIPPAEGASDAGDGLTTTVAAPAVPEAPEATTTLRLCPACHGELPALARFCMHCGLSQLEDSPPAVLSELDALIKPTGHAAADLQAPAPVGVDAGLRHAAPLAPQAVGSPAESPPNETLPGDGVTTPEAAAAQSAGIQTKPLRPVSALASAPILSPVASQHERLCEEDSRLARATVRRVNDAIDTTASIRAELDALLQRLQKRPEDPVTRRRKPLLTR